eukprot:TRINITY_DN4845_c0_g1_i2.p3 TRINITY_DN4845_c0_g1~~TRINITY_DN4845_c0_g1_i2.p3  ORF type:complete len:133 (-),score=6.50 TRINITY_DN4845_c0_g1_i2:208-606(-)
MRIFKTTTYQIQQKNNLTFWLQLISQNKNRKLFKVVIALKSFEVELFVFIGFKIGNSEWFYCRYIDGQIYGFYQNIILQPRNIIIINVMECQLVNIWRDYLESLKAVQTKILEFGECQRKFNRILGEVNQSG